MAERRMFAKTIIDSDAFLDMPLSTQALYFHLSMRADDEGFINNPKKIQRVIGASDDDMKVLLAKNFVIAFESGVIVIKHWRIHNYIRADRLVKTAYIDEKSLIEIKENGAYTVLGSLCPSDVSQVTDKCQADVSIGKDSIGKDSKEKNSKKFVPPTLEEVTEYAATRGNKVDPKKFFDYYQTGEWKDAKGNPVKSWKQKMITWESREPSTPKPEANKKIHNFSEREYDYEALRREMGITT